MCLQKMIDSGMLLAKYVKSDEGPLKGTLTILQNGVDWVPYDLRKGENRLVAFEVASFSGAVQDTFAEKLRRYVLRPVCVHIILQDSR